MILQLNCKSFWTISYFNIEIRNNFIDISEKLIMIKYFAIKLIKGILGCKLMIFNLKMRPFGLTASG
jgi:hypothetical protein